MGMNQVNWTGNEWASPIHDEAKLSKFQIISALKSELLFKHANDGFHQQKALSTSQ
jgi:hypothetical protein